MNMRLIRLGLSLLGVGGVAFTSWLSIRCHEKAKEEEKTKDKMLAYSPAIGSGIVTAGCIMGAYGVGSKEIAALTAGCGYFISKRDKFEKLVKDKFGDKAYKEIKREAGIQEINEVHEVQDKKASGVLTNYGECYEYTGKGKQKFFFYEQGRRFISTYTAVLEADKRLNYDVSSGKLLPVWNDYYDYLGIHRSRIGEDEIISEKELLDNYDTNKPIRFEYMDVEDESGELVTMIYVDKTVPPFLKGE